MQSRAHCSLVAEGKILLGGLNSGQAGHQLLQHVTSKLADHFIKDFGHMEVGQCQTVPGKVVWVSAAETSVAGEIPSTGTVHIHGDWGQES